MAGNDLQLFNRLTDRLRCFEGDILVRSTVETVTADAVFFIE
jgi:hypothetical protein